MAIQKDDMKTLRITFVALPATVPGVIRFRRLLKHALRSLDLRAVYYDSGGPDVTPLAALELEGVQIKAIDTVL